MYLPMPHEAGLLLSCFESPMRRSRSEVAGESVDALQSQRPAAIA
jgi:hypothetical protein